MTAKEKNRSKPVSHSIELNLTGNVSGQVAVGENISQTQKIQTGLETLTDFERKMLFDLIAELKKEVVHESPVGKQEAALEKVTELEQAITAEEPDISTMEHIRNWFVSNVPQIAGTVTGLIVNPIVGQMAEAAGEAVTQEFKNRFRI